MGRWRFACPSRVNRVDPHDYSKSRRCADCRLPPTLCVCDMIERVEVPFELILIQHRSEVRSVSNTGTIAAAALEPSRRIIYEGTSNPQIEAALAGDGPSLTRADRCVDPSGSGRSPS